MKKSLIASAILALGLAAPAAAAPVQWTTASGGNDHWYEVIYLGGGEITWDQANISAQSMSHDGETGYLASITSAAEQAFLNILNHAYAVASPFHNSYYVTAWIGANDVATEGAWEWTSGEAFSYTNWSGGEPNNYLNEDHVQGWWSGDRWNDCRGTCGTYKYVVEYNPSQVPLPASLPLIAAGLGALGLFGRRRKKS